MVSEPDYCMYYIAISLINQPKSLLGSQARKRVERCQLLPSKKIPLTGTEENIGRTLGEALITLVLL